MPIAVEVFRIRLGAAVESAHAWLSVDERARAARFLRPVDRDHYTVAHAALRLILAARLGGVPQALVFRTGSHGKPALPGIEFNLSHSGGIALVAVATVAVGVDVERIAPLDVAALARQHFSAAECVALEQLPPERRLAAFYAGWTRKEAFVKATGAGLLATRPDADEARRWHLTDIDVGAGHAAALCVAGAEPAAISLTDFAL